MAPSFIEFVRERFGKDFLGHIIVWVRQTKRTYFFDRKQWRELEELVMRLGREFDVYVGLATQTQISTGRGTSETVAAVPGLVADIDSADKKSSNKSYPTREEALVVLEEFPFAPTYILETGGGLQAHWFFDDPLITDIPEALKRAKDLSRGFQRRLIAAFKARNRDIDNVGDLVRVFRPPHTRNHKYSPPAEVKILHHNRSARRPVADYAEFALPARNKASHRRAVVRSAPANHEKIKDGCAWYRNVVVDGAETCDEPNWHAGASITARCEDGGKIFHAYSCRHPDYAEREASKKLERALTEGGPRTCESVAKDLAHAGCATCPHSGKITSPIQLGAPDPSRASYEPGKDGPLALGYVGGEFVFRHQHTKEVVRRSAVSLIMPAGLLELAPRLFWLGQFPKLSQKMEIIGIDCISACDALIQGCRSAGAMDVSQIRGLGVWTEDERLVVNLGGEEIPSARFVYTAPKRLELTRAEVPIEQIEAFFKMPRWKTARAPELLLGWAAASVICGALGWRPHAGITGPAAAGKSTILRGLGYILSPLAIIKEGISTEAGIRQSIGYDARPVILDELEQDSARDRGRVDRIIKLMRSSSSADGSVARGTPEGKALNFTTRAMFAIGAINIHRNSAADMSRLVPFECQRIDPDTGRASNMEVRRLLDVLKGCGPTFCQLVIDHARDILQSIPIVHGVLPVTQERQADNMATLLAGYWVVRNLRAITNAEASSFVLPFAEAIEQQKEGVELDDAGECLNALLGYSTFIEMEHESKDGHAIMRKETMSLGLVVANACFNDGEAGTYGDAMRQVGIRLEGKGFMVANSHPGLQRIFRGTRWEGGEWGSALSRLHGAVRLDMRRFSDGVRSRATWVPETYLPNPDPRPDPLY